MKKLLKLLWIVQEVSNEQRHKAGLDRLGKGYFNAYRLNPYNPLSYIIAIATLIVYVPLFGFIGTWRDAIEAGNPFKWN